MTSIAPTIWARLRAAAVQQSRAVRVRRDARRLRQLPKRLLDDVGLTREDLGPCFDGDRR